MKTKNGLAVVLIVLAFILTLTQVSRADDASSSLKTVLIERSDLVQTVPGGEIDWGKQMMYASAQAPIQPADKESNRARAYLRARDFAKMEAIARLLMVVEGTTVTYQGTGKELMDTDKDLRRTIEGYIKNVEIISSEKVQLHGEDAVKVTVGTRIYGEATPGSAFLGTLAGVEKPKQPPLMEIPVEVSVRVVTRVSSYGSHPGSVASSRPFDPVVEIIAPPSEGPYTSLIIDARGYIVPQAISPKIRKLNGDQVYGTLASKSDPAVRAGTVSYARTPEAARESERCGDNPLVVKAIGRGGGRSMCDVIVSDKTAEEIRAENQISGFLDAKRVIFIVDAPGSGLKATTSSASNNLDGQVVYAAQTKSVVSENPRAAR